MQTKQRQQHTFTIYFYKRHIWIMKMRYNKFIETPPKVLQNVLEADQSHVIKAIIFAASLVSLPVHPKQETDCISPGNREMVT